MIASALFRALLALFFLRACPAPSPAAAELPGASRAPEHAVFEKTQDGEFDQAILEAAEGFGVDPWLLKGLLINESRLNPRMRSRGGVGIASMTPAGVRGVNEVRRGRGGHEFEPFSMAKAMDPFEAIPAAAELLGHYTRLYGVAGGIAAYNGGHQHGRAVSRLGYSEAQKRGALRWCGSVRMSGVYVTNVFAKANLLRSEAGLPPLRLTPPL